MATPLTKFDIDRLKLTTDALTGVELRGGLVVVRPSTRSDGGTRVVATFENADTARNFVGLAAVLVELLDLAAIGAGSQAAGTAPGS